MKFCRQVRSPESLQQAKRNLAKTVDEHADGKELKDRRALTGELWADPDQQSFAREGDKQQSRRKDRDEYQFGGTVKDDRGSFSILDVGRRERGEKDRENCRGYEKQF